MSHTADAPPRATTRRKTIKAGSVPNDDAAEGSPTDRLALPPGTIHLPEVTARTMVRLALAGIEPLLEIDDWAAILACSRREVDKLRAAGTLPPPDDRVGKMPRWRAATVRRWLQGDRS